MNSRLKANLLHPRQMPPPHQSCKTYDFVQTMELIRNFEKYTTPVGADKHSEKEKRSRCNG